MDSLKIENLKIRPIEIAVYGFTRSYILLLGSVQLPLTIGDKPYQKTTMIEFQVVDLKMLYTMIVGKSFFRKTKAVESILFET